MQLYANSAASGEAVRNLCRPVPRTCGMAAPCPSTAITMRGRVDGFGAQYAATMSVYSWARRSGRPYCATPWPYLQHDGNASALYALVGGHRYGPPATSATEGATEKHIELSRARFGANETAWHLSLRTHYHHSAAPKPQLQWGAPGPHVAVHVRRGDVSMSVTPLRFTTNGLIARCVMNVLARMSGRGAPKPSVHIFSQGRAADFGSLLKVPRVRLHLNTPLESTFHHLVSADALVMAKSTLSDCAAFLSEGRIFQQPSTGGGGLLHYVHRTNWRIERC
eukprot:5980464-Prymnesium_polylepis.1